MNNIELHNPEEIPEGYQPGPPHRFLTVTEAAVLTDPIAYRQHAGQVLFKHLQPLQFSQGSCQWEAVRPSPEALKIERSYMTAAAIMSLPTHNPEELQAACADFVESWNYLAAYHHELMKGKGFWDGENSVIACLAEHAPGLVPIAIAAFDGQKIALVTSESSEKLEALRHGNGPDDKVPQFTGAEAEGADELLRIMDHSHAREWNIAEALVAKMFMNANRQPMHGGKVF